jgi:predicted nucleic acid-binding protein
MPPQSSRKVIYDTNIYIGAIRGGVHSSEFDLLRRSLPYTYLCSVVSAELFAGAIDSLAARLTAPFVLMSERVGRVVTPSHRSWNEAGRILGKIGKSEPQFRSKLPALFNDALIALSASQIGAAVCTRDKEDFELLRHYWRFRLELFIEKL